MKNCSACGSSATLACGGCGDVVYCGVKCQKAAWKAGHKNECKAYKIENHPDYGRYLVATRELKPGSKILTKLQPAVVGPPLINPNYECQSVYMKTCNNSELHQLLAKLPKTNLQVISPLTLLLLEKSNPKNYEQLMKLESHTEELKKSERWNDLKKNVIDPIIEISGESEDKITNLVGILCTNSFELLSHAKGKVPFSGLFELASLMNHDCIGNTRLA